MTIHQIYQAYDQIIGSIDCKNLKDAFDFLHKFIVSTSECSFQDRLDELQETYKNMLRYRIEGAKDPMQDQIYNNLVASTYELADSLKHKTLATDSPLSFYSKRRIMQKEHMNYAQLHKLLDVSLLSTIATDNESISAQKQLESATLMLFNKIWTSDFLTSEEVLQIRDILTDPEISTITNCQIVSALMLGLQASFDKEKLFLLFDAADIVDEDIRYRALTCILITLYTYRKRTALYPQIAFRLESLSDSFPRFKKAVLTITLHFITSRETEKITKKIEQEIFPDLTKYGPMNINLDSIGQEMNPEWLNLLNNQDFNKLMMEFDEMKADGLDILHGSFIHLKNYPFFREIGNWFAPFTLNHSIFKDAPEITKKMFDMPAFSTLMCNSDKYSFFLTLMSIPKESRNALFGNMNTEEAEALKNFDNELLLGKDKMDIITKQYVLDLYRFFKLYPSHLDFNDIFSYTLDFHNLPILRPYISDEKSLTTLAEFYLHKKYFDDALTIYNFLNKRSIANEMIYQKIGYCKQMNNDITGALEAYLQADLLNPNSKWCLRRIASCYRTLKQPEKALPYLNRYEILSPDNFSVQINIGHCYLELKKYEEALKYFFKVDYLEANSIKAWRSIAWCSFLIGKYDQARSYYKKIIDNEPNAQDFMNAGHTEWALQNIKGTIDFYTKALEKEKYNFSKFQEQFNQDIPDLKAVGIEDSEIPLILDQLRYIATDIESQNMDVPF